MMRSDTCEHIHEFIDAVREEVEGSQGPPYLPLKVLVKSLVNYYAKINYFIGAPFEFCNLRDPNQECIKRYPGPSSWCIILTL
jgi:hypothetical protein